MEGPTGFRDEVAGDAVGVVVIGGEDEILVEDDIGTVGRAEGRVSGEDARNVGVREVHVAGVGMGNVGWVGRGSEEFGEGVVGKMTGGAGEFGASGGDGLEDKFQIGKLAVEGLAGVNGTTGEVFGEEEVAASA